MKGKGLVLVNSAQSWQLTVQFPRPQEDAAVSFLPRLIPEGLIRIWHPLQRTTWYRLSMGDKDLPRLLRVLQALQNEKNMQVFVNRLPVPAETLWALNCYANPESLYRPCEVQKSSRFIIGCPQGYLSLEAHHPAAWYTKLKPASECLFQKWVLADGTWREFLKARLGNFYHCPELARRGHLEDLDRLPTELILSGETAAVFTSVPQGNKQILRVKNRELYEDWLAGVFADD